MPSPESRRGPLAALIRVLWRAPLLAIPFALFFGLLMGRGRAEYVLLYDLATVFAYANGLALWLMEYFGIPALRARGIVKDPVPRLVATSILAGASLAGSAIAAILIH